MDLANLAINYETIDPYPVIETISNKVKDLPECIFRSQLNTRSENYWTVISKKT